MTPADWAGLPAPVTEAASAALALVADVPLPGPAKRFDYQSFDSTTGRLYIAHMRGDRLVVFDTRTGKVFVSDESGAADLVIDARSNRATGHIALGGEAGNTRYDGVSHCIVVAVQTKNELVAIDPATQRIVARWIPGWVAST